MRDRILKLLETLRMDWLMFCQGDFYIDDDGDYHTGNPRTRWIRFVHEEWMNGIWWRIVEHTWCRWRGHDLLDDGSHAGPESGYEALRCCRCGWSWRHVYY